jgi:hypothetical protein
LVGRHGVIGEDVERTAIQAYLQGISGQFKGKILEVSSAVLPAAPMPQPSDVQRQQNAEHFFSLDFYAWGHASASDP